MATLVETKDGVVSASGRVTILAPVTTLTKLAALAVYSLTDGAGVMVISEEDYYIWIATSTHTPDGSNVILPASYNESSPSMGRWVREIEKAMASGVATLDSNLVLEQAAKKVYAQSETLTWNALTDGAPVIRSGSTLASSALVQSITTSTSAIPSAAAVKTFVEAQDAAQNEIHEITGNTMYVSGDNVGIGTDSPAALLELNAEHPKLLFKASSANGDGQVIFKSLDGTQLANFRCDTTSNALNHFGINAGTSEDHLVLKADGKVGIGTTSPATTLDVDGNVTADTPTASTHLVTKAYCDAQSGGSSSLSVVSKTANYTVLTTDDVVHANPGSQTTITMTLPTASSAGSGKKYLIKHTGTGNTVVVDTAGGNIDGSSTGEVLTTLESTTVVSDGTDYWIH